MGKGVIQSILDFLFPPRCPVCRAYVEQLGDWCPACMKAAQQPHAILLPALSQRFIGAVWALGIYRGGLRSLIHALKYRKKRSALPCIASFLQESCFVLPEGVDVAVPVPLHEARYRQRGFNQVELIFGEWLSAHGIAMEQALVRTRKTEPLYKMVRQERKKILQGAFSLASGADVRGKHILLLDDILTTGRRSLAVRLSCAKPGLRASMRSSLPATIAEWHGIPF